MYNIIIIIISIIIFILTLLYRPHSFIYKYKTCMSY